MKNLYLVTATVLFFYTTFAYSEVYVASEMRADAVSKNVIVNAGAYKVIPLVKSGNSNDSYKIQINTENEVYRDLSAFIVDEENLISFTQGYRFKGAGYNKAQTPFVIEAKIPSDINRYLVIDNRYALVIKKKVSFTVESKFQPSEQELGKVKQSFASMYAGLKKNFIFPDFDIHIEPCGQANAYSDGKKGDIHMCSELIDQLGKSGNDKALLGVFLHEFGHTALNLWGIPGHNNEDIADEFATYIFMSSGPNGYQFLDATLQFWQGRDSVNEALKMLQSGDRHSISIQRMRNIKENMITGEAFIKRWNKLLYEHFTDYALNEVLSKPMPGADTELAKKIVSQRLSASN